MKSVFGNTTFRRLFVGRLVTNVGDSLYYIAAMWLVYELGGSAFYTGLAGFLTMTPPTLQFLLGPFVDRWDLRRLLVSTQVLQGLLVLVIPLAAMTGWLSVTVVLVVMPVLSMLNQFVYPAQHAALPRIVGDEELTDANSAFTFAYQGVDTVFISLGGVLVALVGAVSLYLIDSVTFAATALIFATIRIPAADGDENETQPDTGRIRSAVSEYRVKLREGIGYVRGTILVLTLAGSMVVNFCIGAMMAVLPAFAATRGGAESYGLLLAAMTAGLLIGALGASVLKQVPMSWLSVVGFGLGGFAWIGAVSVQWLPATIALFCLAWIPAGVSNVIFMTLVQTYVPERLVGRVSSLSNSVSAAAMPVGSLLGGIAGDTIGGIFVVTVTGLGFLFLALYWVGHPLLRHVPAVEKIDPVEYGLGEA